MLSQSCSGDVIADLPQISHQQLKVNLFCLRLISISAALMLNDENFGCQVKQEF